MKADKETTFMRPSTFGGRATVALLALTCLLAGATRAAARQAAPSGPDAADPPAPQKTTVTVSATSEPKPSLAIYGFAMLDIGHELQADQPELVRHHAGHEAAVVRRISSARTTARSPACARAGSASRRRRRPPRRAEDDLRVRAVRHGRGRGPDHVPPAPRVRRARSLRRGPDLEPVHGPGRLPQLARVLGPDRHGVLPQRPGPLDADQGRHAA